MRTLLQTIVLALVLTAASAVLAPQEVLAQQEESASPDSPVPMPFDGDRDEQANQDDQTSQDNQSPKSDVERAKMLLMGYHGLPSKETFEDNLDQPKVVVTSIALDQDGFTLHRKRALAALGYWADAGVMRHYTQLLADAQTPETLHHATILLLAKHFPKEALGHLKPYLAHANLQYRLSAIEAIRRLPSDDAVEALREALKTETNAVAKRRLEKYSQVVR